LSPFLALVVCKSLSHMFTKWVRILGLKLTVSHLVSICIVSLLRVIFSARNNMEDFHYSQSALVMWSIVEPQLGAINACLPVMRPLLIRASQSKAFRKFFLSSSDARSRPTDHYSGVRKSWRRSNGVVLRNEVDKLYPLDTVHLVKTPDSGIGFERVSVTNGYAN
jgi:hypothetical protein